MAILLALFKTVRPRQWVKNFALFAALVFSGLLFQEGAFSLVFQAFLVFTIFSSITYIFNDLVDVEADRKHPYKKSRPIASGGLPIPMAIFSLVVGVVVGLSWAMQINYYLFISGLAYLILQIFYTSYLKNVPIVDVIVIASGYLIRVYAGAFTISAHMDVWFLMTVIAASLFLAVGKRRSEMTLLLNYKEAETRATLKRYTEHLLDIYTAMFATGTWITYALFTFNHPRIIPDGRALDIISILPRTLISEKWLMVTIPFVVYGIMRYLQLIYERNEGESPERILLSDKPLMATVISWGVMVIGVLYYVG
ncbi:MAG: UbiA prenyltransferase [Candidatus Collierbacteria bacterium GW2011_GWB1_45_35]|uniref:UbiA prenyltransferase n=1 Tax=Candidatus Collierbacteria bacterium GW2011_GWB2_45_17 TaxID=1618388 RepID=A0A837ILX8_9BACT|nr:MAG: UbiA prenyltransferase [Microgenomates group bacterium GW2011_GWC1_44_23]KKT96022.1 MAG: UbiA prenyltransferase [Candidatus Collierbacteria bacterium GW2011_GWA1_45_15]KKU01105.1 MAG: UbiA prenyltransferase [Candidatus Collierbacteria bacterium GW2011_GWB2_45_17]KKU05717.1 MAG: UbiA prenyltransferase [Candidatus Collierbacteria bacterium GW2011_GWB1_45_35]KKU08084.1 MAG: UbiA prenyltransferase [Candidatus Collierbacteria bacterium GW2011_GWC2_45_40]HBC45149.1 decaprenyl-phosphate phosp